MALHAPASPARVRAWHRIIVLPELLFDPLGKALAQLILSGQSFAEITEISVDEGQMTISGQYHRDKLGL